MELHDRGFFLFVKLFFIFSMMVMKVEGYKFELLTLNLPTTTIVAQPFLMFC
jgi:hypothetical protein